MKHRNGDLANLGRFITQKNVFKLNQVHTSGWSWPIWVVYLLSAYNVEGGSHEFMLMTSLTNLLKA